MFAQLKSPYDQYTYNPVTQQLVRITTGAPLKCKAGCGFQLSYKSKLAYFNFAELEAMIDHNATTVSNTEYVAPVPKFIKLKSPYERYSYDVENNVLINTKLDIKMTPKKSGGFQMATTGGRRVHLSINRIKNLLSETVFTPTTGIPADDTPSLTYVLRGEYSNYAFNPSLKKLYRISTNGTSIKELKKHNTGQGFSVSINGTPRYLSHIDLKRQTSDVVFVPTAVNSTNTPINTILRPNSVVPKLDVPTVEVPKPDVIAVNIKPNPTECSVAGAPRNMTTDTRFQRLPQILSNYVYDCNTNTLNSMSNGVLKPLTPKTSSSWVISVKGTPRSITLELIFALINTGKTTNFKPLTNRSGSVWILVSADATKVEDTKYDSVYDATTAAKRHAEDTGEIYDIYQLVGRTNVNKVQVTKVA